MFFKIKVRHFRSLKWIYAYLKNFNILIGPNASGKSNFLDVFNFIKDLLHEDVERAIKRRTNNFKDLVWMGRDVEEGFEFSLSCLLPKEYHVTLRKDTFNAIKYLLKVGFDPNAGEVGILREDLYLFNTNYDIKEKVNRTLFPEVFPDPRIVPVGGKIRTPKGHRLVVRRREYGRRVYLKSEKTDYNITLDVNPRKSALSVILEDETRFRTSLWFRNLLSDSLLFIHLNVEEMRKPVSPFESPVFKPDGSNLPMVIKNLMDNHKDLYKWYVEHVKAYLEDVEDVTVKSRPEDNFIYLVVKYRYGYEAPSWMLSDGTLRFLALALIPYLPPQNRIFLIEEPENGIHPGAIEGVFEALSATWNSQVLVATHSPIFLKLAYEDDLLIFRKTHEGSTDIIRGKEHKELKRWKGKTDLDVLFVGGIL